MLSLSLGLGLSPRIVINPPFDGELPEAPVGFAYLVDNDGAYLTDSDGAYLIAGIA